MPERDLSKPIKTIQIHFFKEHIHQSIIKKNYKPIKNIFGKKTF